ncbi:MAG: MFS transporter [Thiobacillus sp.]|uniref:MFS transporter n=1 Tax=Thiobacillus sp. TaxID=924 RepID=UPI00289624C7|nr:MFS transporter [Thiobacillus sp.]MDT3705563.1 MFS transporter [Thiobacillus sp.]
MTLPDPHGAALTSQPPSNRLPPIPLAWLTWGLLASLYFVGFFQRVAPAVMVDELMRDFAIAATMLGNLSAVYFYTYAAMQIPSGLLADAVGPRRVGALAAVAAAAGIALFALADSLWTATLGRGLVGASVAVAFVACMKLAGHWFPANRFATVTGISLLIGNLGGVLAGVPLSEAVSGFGWRAAMLASAAATLVLALFVWLWVRDDPTERGYASHAHPEALNNGTMSAARALMRVVSERDTWLLFFAGGLIAAPVLTFAGLWGVPYLVQVHGLERSHAAVFTTVMLLGFAVGGPLLGALSDRMGRRKPPYLGAALAHALGWMIFLLAPDLSSTALYLLFAVIGFSAGGLIIGFAFSREANHPGAAGTVGGVVNMAVLGFAAIQQSAMGWILDRNWRGTVIEGARVYDAAAYHAAFLWLAISAAGAVVFVALTRETRCRLRFDSDG